MIGRYLGHLDHHDPLHGYLRDHIIPQLGVGCGGRRVPRIPVGVFAPRLPLRGKTQQCAAGRQVPSPSKHIQARTLPKRGKRNSATSCLLRGLGLDSPPHYVVKPLGLQPGHRQRAADGISGGRLPGHGDNRRHAPGQARPAVPQALGPGPFSGHHAQPHGRRLAGSTSTTAMPTWGGCIGSLIVKAKHGARPLR